MKPPPVSGGASLTPDPPSLQGGTWAGGKLGAGLLAYPFDYLTPNALPSSAEEVDMVGEFLYAFDWAVGDRAFVRVETIELNAVGDQG